MPYPFMSPQRLIYSPDLCSRHWAPNPPRGLGILLHGPYLLSQCSASEEMAPEKRFLSNYYYFNSTPKDSLPWSFYTVLFFLRRYRKWFSQKAKTLRNISSASPLTTLLFSRVQLFATPWTAARQAPLSFTISWSLLKLMSIESVMPSNYLILCHPLLLSSVFPSIRVFSSELALCIRWPKYWNFSFSLSPSNEYTVH